MGYDIIQSLLPAPVNAYQNGQYEGVKLYCTNMQGILSGAFASGVAQYSEFMHYFVDNRNIYRVADINSTGATDDERYVHIAVCTYYDDGVFIREAYPRYTWLIAKTLLDKELPVVVGETLFLDDTADKFESHYGIQSGQFFRDVQTQYNRIVSGQI